MCFGIANRDRQDALTEFRDACGKDWDDCLISDVIIKPSERGSGYGKLLIKEALKLAKDNFDGKEAHVVLLDSGLAEWYQEMGFEAEETDAHGLVYGLKIKI